MLLSNIFKDLSRKLGVSGVTSVTLPNKHLKYKDNIDTPSASISVTPSFKGVTELKHLEPNKYDCVTRTGYSKSEIIQGDRSRVTSVTPVTLFSHITNYAILEALEERAAIMEFDGGLSKIEAEAQALEDIVMIPDCN